MTRTSGHSGTALILTYGTQTMVNEGELLVNSDDTEAAHAILPIIDQIRNTPNTGDRRSAIRSLESPQMRSEGRRELLEWIKAQETPETSQF